MNVVVKPVSNLQTGAYKSFKTDNAFLNRIIFLDKFFFHVNGNVDKHNAKICVICLLFRVMRGAGMLTLLNYAMRDVLRGTDQYILAFMKDAGHSS